VQSQRDSRPSAVPEDVGEGDGEENETRLLARVGAVAIDLLTGDRARLRDLWSSRPTVVAFVRQFGCLFCHEMVAGLVGAVPAIRARDAALVVVGNGTLEQARRFYAMKGLPVTGVVVGTDPDRESYRAAELDRGFAKTFANGGSAAAYARARGKGFKIKGVFGDVFQLGGILVVLPGQRLAFRHVSRFAGDHPDMGQVLGALGA
jgi:hypothetical protein